MANGQASPQLHTDPPEVLPDPPPLQAENWWYFILRSRWRLFCRDTLSRARGRRHLPAAALSTGSSAAGYQTPAVRCWGSCCDTPRAPAPSPPLPPGLGRLRTTSDSRRRPSCGRGLRSPLPGARCPGPAGTGQPLPLRAPPVTSAATSAAGGRGGPRGR